MGGIEREQTRGLKRGMDLRVYRYQGGNSDSLRQNSERRSLGKSRRIQNRRESRVEPFQNSSEQPKGKEGTERERGMGDVNGTSLFFIFWRVMFCVCKECNHKSKKK
jgi:hypothetical protein